MDRVTGLVGWGHTVHVVYVDFSKALARLLGTTLGEGGQVITVIISLSGFVWIQGNMMNESGAVWREVSSSCMCVLALSLVLFCSFYLPTSLKLYLFFPRYKSITLRFVENWKIQENTKKISNQL